MTDQRVRAAKLAGELGVSLVKLQALMQDMDILAPNGSSVIASRDVERLR